jgi:hypothetical protein
LQVRCLTSTISGVRIRALSVAICFVFLAPSFRSQDVPVGVLVGIQNPSYDSTNGKPPSGGSLRTVWVPLDQPAGLSHVDAIQLSYLLIPRKTGFWQAGLAGTCDERTMLDADDKPFGIAATVADYFWAAPAGGRGSIRLRDTDEKLGSCRTREPRCENDNRTIVYWVWPDFVPMDASDRSECGVHPDADLHYMVRSLDSLQTAKTPVDILGPAAEAPFRAAFDKAMLEAGGEKCLDDIRPRGWRIERKNGDWKAIGWESTQRSCGYGFDFEPALDLTPITGRKYDARWEKLRSRIPKITDAHFSPAGAWILVATPKQLMILRGESDKPVVTLPLSEFENLIMVEWSTGRNVARWTEEIRRLQNVKPQPPDILPPGQ